MALGTGSRLGPYEILSPLGSGGMGEVYRAHDTRLARDVALKVIAAEATGDSGRLARFEQEARATAALNHPHIVAVFDVGQSEQGPYIVSELLEGETLRERLMRGRVPVRAALEWGVQIARALAAAHDKGIVHRDLKPGNVFITREGTAKVLDFGLAKLKPLSGGSMASTMGALEMSGPGAVLGTAGYMAPEQVRGEEADERADIFALGCVLYELLSGGRAFSGTSAVETMHAILATEPLDLTALPQPVPLPLERIVRRCLEKDRGQRFQSSRDLAFAIEAVGESRSSTSGSVTAPERRPGASVWLARGAIFVLGAALGAGILAWVASPIPLPPESEVRFELSALAPYRFGSAAAAPFLAVAPSGRHVALVVQTPEGIGRLAVRSLDRFDVKILAGTEGSTLPFWSPDSRSIGFFADGKLKVVEVAGGLARTLCDAAPGGGTWRANGTILFGGAGPILSVTSQGGTPVPVTTLEANESEHRHPIFLPDGRHFLFVARPALKAWLGALDSAARKPLAETESKVEFARGALVYRRQGALVAQPFDLDSLAVTGDWIPVTDSVGANSQNGNAAFSVSDACVIGYRYPVASATGQLTWFDGAGKLLGTSWEPGNLQGLDLEPDGRRIAVHRHVEAGGDVWIVDSDRGTASNLTLDPTGHYISPCWTSEGHVAYVKVLDKSSEVWWRAAGGGGEEKLHTISLPGNHTLTDCRGSAILISQAEPDADQDIWALSLQGNRTARKLLGDRFIETQGQLSPDGRWLAYQSNETGRFEVYVQPYPPRGESKVPISTAGGSHPRWRPDGGALFYLALDGKMTRADVTAKGRGLNVGSPRTLFDARPSGGALTYTIYAVTRDGRFLVVTNAAVDDDEPLRFVVNWRPSQSAAAQK